MRWEEAGLQVPEAGPRMRPGGQPGNGVVCKDHSYASHCSGCIFFFFFFAALGLRCFMQAFSSFGARASHCHDCSCCRAQALGTRASVVVAFRLNSCGTWA